MTRETQTFSARWDISVLERLGRRSKASGLNRSRLAERYVDEGIRMEEHPGIVFRSGKAGRRAALVGGPDVWELIATLMQSQSKGEMAISQAADVLGLTERQVGIGVRYYGDYPHEIDHRIKGNVEDADAAESAWRRIQANSS
jgi:hypothetical protein